LIPCTLPGKSNPNHPCHNFGINKDGLCKNPECLRLRIDDRYHALRDDVIVSNNKNAADAKNHQKSDPNVVLAKEMVMTIKIKTLPSS
jgi:hypothetical protein